LPDPCLELLRAADLILHVGDVTGAALLAELETLAPVRAVRGNVDAPELAARLPERLVVEAEGRRIGLVHDGGPREGRHGRLRALFPGCDVVAYGHSHQPELEHEGGVWFLNPGSPTERRRAPARTMIVLRRGEPELVELP